MALSATEQSFTASTTEISLLTGTSTLTPDDTDGIWQVDIFIASMAVADKFLLTLKGKITSGDSERVLMEIPIEFGMSSPLQVAPRWNIHAFNPTLIKVAGTDRTATTCVKRVS